MSSWAEQGEQLVATSYGFASWMGIDITPTFVINDKKKVMGLPANFSDIGKTMIFQISVLSSSVSMC
jgi:hypothetical protein